MTPELESRIAGPSTRDRPSDDLGQGGSLLARVAPDARDALLADARVWLAAAGAPIFPPAAQWVRAGIIQAGIARACLASSDGREVTVRYVRPGGMIGNVVPIAGDRAPLAIEAVTDCRVLELDADRLRGLIATDSEVAQAVLEELSQRLEDVYATLAASAFGSMRERVAGQLLHLAVADETSGRLLVRATQQQLADGVGSVREVVARALRKLRDDGLVATAPGTIEILHPARLASHVGRWRERPGS